MKTLVKINYCLLYSLICITAFACSRSPVSENKDVDSSFVQSDSIVFAQERLMLGDELVELRNYIDTTIFVLTGQKAKMKGDEAKSLEAAITNLSLNKDKVERDLQEVNSTALKSWDQDYTARIRTTMKEVRTECDRITQEVVTVN